MPLVLVRIDDRLIHGQVVEGWLRVIQAARIVVASDQAAGDPLQGCLMRLAVPPEVQVSVLSVDDAAKALAGGGDERVLLLLPGLKEALRLVRAGVKIESLNLGGLHDAAGRSPVTPSLSLGEEDWRDVRALLALKVAIETRPLPGDEKKPVQDYMKETKG